MKRKLKAESERLLMQLMDPAVETEKMMRLVLKTKKPMTEEKETVR